MNALEAPSIQLQKKWKPTTIKDLKLTAKPLGRQARLIYLPAHAVSYQYGQGFTASGERRPYTFQVYSLTQLAWSAVFIAAIWAFTAGGPTSAASSPAALQVLELS